MKTVKGFPPNIKEINNVLPTKGKSRVIYTYGDTVYIPNGEPLSDDLEVHESVHVVQQAEMGADVWWKRFLDEPEFRLSQELEAYRAQWLFIKVNKNRKIKRAMFKHIVDSLSSPTYGNMVTRIEAEELLEKDDPTVGSRRGI